MKADEYFKEQKFSYDHFTKLTSTGIEHDVFRVCEFAESYHKHELKKARYCSQCGEPKSKPHKFWCAIKE